jgi:hypothetical protein
MADDRELDSESARKRSGHKLWVTSRDQRPGCDSEHNKAGLHYTIRRFRVTLSCRSQTISCPRLVSLLVNPLLGIAKLLSGFAFRLVVGSFVYFIGIFRDIAPYLLAFTLSFFPLTFDLVFFGSHDTGPFDVRQAITNGDGFEAARSL